MATLGFSRSMDLPTEWDCVSHPGNEWCTADGPCFDCAELAHELEHPSMDVDGCRTCRLRSVQLSPAATPTKTRKFHPVGVPKGNNSWERPVVTDARGMPLLRADGEMIRTKEYAERRSSIEAARRVVANALTPTS